MLQKGPSIDLLKFELLSMVLFFQPNVLNMLINFSFARNFKGTKSQAGYANGIPLHQDIEHTLLFSSTCSAKKDSLATTRIVFSINLLIKEIKKLKIVHNNTAVIKFSMYF